MRRGCGSRWHASSAALRQVLRAASVCTRIRDGPHPTCAWACQMVLESVAHGARAWRTPVGRSRSRQRAGAGLARSTLTVETVCSRIPRAEQPSSRARESPRRQTRRRYEPSVGRRRPARERMPSAERDTASSGRTASQHGATRLHASQRNSQQATSNIYLYTTHLQATQDGRSRLDFLCLSSFLYSLRALKGIPAVLPPQMLMTKLSAIFSQRSFSPPSHLLLVPEASRM